MKVMHAKPVPPVHMSITKKPFDLISIALPKTSRNNENLLVVADAASSWMLAQTVIKEMRSYLASILKGPRLILSDNAKVFRSKEFVKDSSMHHIFSSPYHPQAIGKCERFNLIMLNQLRALSEGCKDWDNYIAKVELVHNHTVSNS
jgi:hypothetical protein